VEGLTPGLYLLPRRSGRRRELATAFRPGFAWQRPPGCPRGLPLVRLAEGELQDEARAVSCGQDIAADGCFSLGMLATFRPALERRGAWLYPRLFWECGAVGQVLYLAAEAAGVRGTGIGCFFDDAVHRLLGLADDGLQSLYHFTVGAPLGDGRLTTLPAYPAPDGEG
jgi:hypothetical protein